ncbi:DegV family protein [Soehngenia longivitae]|uniref:DegV family protein n=1 Tax=Soehngenia longivitae TaxID=2562294 RepID=A0A4Z0D631_9FIRM|nr:DegV family protein [Soehngenia longivitae]TFZ40353.1 DegV family protein [Soehngenia longivitae]
MKVKILTDSASDLPEEIIKEYDIDVLPMTIIKDDKEYKDRVDISPKVIFDGMRNKEVFKTSQVTPIAFEEKFEQYAKQGIPVVYVGFSSELSATYQSSVIAKDNVLTKYPEAKIEVIDTYAASGGFGLIVLEAAKFARAGKEVDEILDRVNLAKESIDHIFTVDDIEYLYRGGRVSRTSAVLGGMLNIKPILEVKDGKLIPLEKVRGKNKVFTRMVELMEERSIDKDFTNATICITHGDDLEGALKLKELIEKRYNAKNFIINMIGATIGAHSGPGTLALFYPKTKL